MSIATAKSSRIWTLTAHQGKNKVDKPPSDVGLYLVVMGVVGVLAPPDGAQICQNSDHELTIWPTTMALWTLTSISTHQALPIGTTKGREGVAGLYLVVMGVVGAMARPDGVCKFAKIQTTN